MTPSQNRPTLQLPRQAERVAQTTAASEDDKPLNSDALLQGRKTVEIAHNGATYRLQATRQGKLILTK